MVNVFAPGVGIITTAPDGKYSHSEEGTSFSAPLVSGVAALVKTRYPNISPDALREQIRLASENMDAENPGQAGQLGRGYVNAEAALQAPAFPAVRLKRWTWNDTDGDRMITSGEEVTIKATVVNHLADARQLSIGLQSAEPYPYIDLSNAEQTVGHLARGDSTEVTLRFLVATNAPPSRVIRFYTRIRDGAFVDEPDQISFGINVRIELVHAALSALYTSTDGDNWRSNRGWDITMVPTPSELAQWHGVHVSHGILRRLYLCFNNLTGTLPAELGNLSGLQNLQLCSNSLSGEIPSELGTLSQLKRLLLHVNSLTGEIPNELGNLSQLQWLSLHTNSLSGEIPSELGNLSELQGMNLDRNSLTGEIPSELGNLSELQSLTLPANSLSGEIPSELGDLSELKYLYLGSNSLSGEVPSELGGLSQLLRLRLDNNSLSGEIPAETGNLSELQELNLWRNSLSGEIPAELGNLSELQRLELSANALSGEIPSDLGNLSQLQYLNLWRNSLSGEIPAELGNLSELQRLELGDNSLFGEIPSELGNLSQLQTLRLGDNSLSGEIPGELGNLSQLQSLNLPNNKLSGEIPSELGHLSTLQSLELARNSLTGEIPGELGNLSELQRMNLGSNSLTGRVPSELGNLSQLQLLYLADNALSGEIPSELGNLSELYYLDLGSNSLAGEIPSELGGLSQLSRLELRNNTLSGDIPGELGNLSQLTHLDLYGNLFTGMLPRSLMQLTNLRQLLFGGQDLCAPEDDAFQAWLSSIPYTNGPTCLGIHFADSVADQTFTVGTAIGSLVLPEASSGTGPYTYTLEPALPAGLVFSDTTRTIGGTPTAVASDSVFTYSATDDIGSTVNLTFEIEVVAAVSFASVVADQSFPRAQPIAQLVLPEATGGAPTVDYTLEPALPAGLTFDSKFRALSGIPTVVMPATPYTYQAADANGSTDSLSFSIEVFSPTSAEHESLPEAFALHGNYPNPFRHSTRLMMDLPWPARVTVEVMDVVGRRVLMAPPVDLTAGWQRSVNLSVAAMPSGLYMYRVHASSPGGRAVHAGRFVHVR